MRGLLLGATKGGCHGGRCQGKGLWLQLGLEGGEEGPLVIAVGNVGRVRTGSEGWEHRCFGGSNTKWG